jgi:ABC-type dipeptide/oligopeptide/nickel transport system ATPase component
VTADLTAPLPGATIDTDLVVSGLTTEFVRHRRRRTVISDVGLTVNRGEFVGLVGETGSGKSVTLRSILRLLPPNGRILAGSVKLGEVELTTASPRELRRVRGRQLGFIPQQPWSALNPVLRLERQFRKIARAHDHLSREQCRELAIQALERVEIDNPQRVLGSIASELSGGMAQRVVMAMVLQLSPRLLLADEPTTALDVTVQREILDLLASVCREDQRSVLLVTHDLGIVANYCHRVVVMKAGAVVEAGSVADVFGSPSAPYTRELLEAARPRHVGQAT